MANYHILTGSRDGNSFRIVMHVAVPNAANEVGVNYRTAIVEYLTNPDTGMMPKSGVPFIVSAEQIQLDSGELVEIGMNFHTHPGETLPEKQARLDSLYTAKTSTTQAEWEKRLSYWGYSRDVP